MNIDEAMKKDLERIRKKIGAELKKAIPKKVDKIPLTWYIYHALFSEAAEFRGKEIYRYFNKDGSPCARLTLDSRYKLQNLDGSDLWVPAVYRFQTQETDTLSDWATLAQYGHKIMWVICDNFKELGLRGWQMWAGMVVDDFVYEFPGHQKVNTDKYGVKHLLQFKHLLEKESPAVATVPSSAAHIQTPPPQEKEVIETSRAVAQMFGDCCETALGIIQELEDGKTSRKETMDLLAWWKDDWELVIRMANNLANVTNFVDFVLSGQWPKRDPIEDVGSLLEGQLLA